MNRIILIFFLSPLCLYGQVNRYFVSFKDKANTTYSLDRPLEFLSQKSLDRRARENFVLVDEDLPVDTAYVHQVKNTGASTFFTSRWFNGVLVQCDASLVPTISALPFVSKVELVAPDARLTNGRKSDSKKFENTESVTTLTDQLQLQMVGLDQMHAAGYHGEGIDVAVFDGGFINVNSMPGFQPLFQESRIKSVFNFVENSTNVYQAHDHGTGTLSILAGEIRGTFLGGAYKANYFLYLTEDVSSEYRIEEYNWLFAAERADSAGVDVISSSLGYNQFDDSSMNYTYDSLDGKTTVISRAASKAFLRGISVVNAAGNEGDIGNPWQYIIAPADVDGVIAVGATKSDGTKSSFSSIGPSADGRVKPDVAALGVNSELFTSNGCCFTNSGTSFACPLVAGLVADLRQMFPQESAKDIYSRLIHMATQFSHPDDKLGYGIPVFRLTEITPTVERQFELYPNPLKDNTLNIVFKDTQTQSLTVDVIDALGRKVYEGNLTMTLDQSTYALNLPTLSAGMYFVRIVTPTSQTSQRFIKTN